MKKSWSTFLSEALKIYKDKIAEDNLALTKLADDFLDSKIVWNGEKITEMHLSLESNPETMTIPGLYPPKEIKEEGHYPVSFLESYFRCLLEVYIQFEKSSKSDDKKIIPIIKDELAILDTLIFTIRDRERCISIKNVPSHIRFMKGMLESIKSDKSVMPLQYEIGYPGHTYYIVYSKKKGMLRGTIFNLGEGCHFHRTMVVDGIRKIEPYILEITDIENHLKNLVCLHDLFSTVPKTAIDDATKQFINQTIYTNGTYYGSLNFYENEQKTGNCVSKNYFFAMRARMHDVNFNQIFKKSINVLNSYKIMFNEGTTGIDTEKTHKNLRDSLDSFKSIIDDTQSVYGSETHLSSPKGKSKDGISPSGEKTQELQTKRDQMAKMIGTTTGVGAAVYLFDSEEDGDMPTWLKFVKSGVIGGVTGLASYYAATNLMAYFDVPSKPEIGENKRAVVTKTTVTVVKSDTEMSSTPPPLPKPSVTGNMHHSFNQGGSQTKEAIKKKPITRSQSLGSMNNHK